MKACLAVVELSFTEMLLGATTGVLRRVRAIFKGFKPAYGANENLWELDIIGALGEMAAAKYLGLYWSDMAIGDHFVDADVGPHAVRTVTNHWATCYLRLHEKDASDRTYFLVVPSREDYRRFIIRGWMSGKEAKQPKYYGDKLRTGRPAYFVPETELHVDENYPV